MLLITHFTLTLLACLIAFPYLANKPLFIIIALISSLIPDIDSSQSKIGKKLIFRPINFFTKHRGFFHSLLFMVLISFFLYLTFKPAVYPFIFGYGLHLIVDSLTLQGTRLFYPLKLRIKGPLKTAGFFEIILLIFCLLAVMILLFLRILSIF